MPLLDDELEPGDDVEPLDPLELAPGSFALLELAPGSFAPVELDSLGLVVLPALPVVPEVPPLDVLGVELLGAGVLGAGVLGVLGAVVLGVLGVLGVPYSLSPSPTPLVDFDVDGCLDSRF